MTVKPSKIKAIKYYRANHKSIFMTTIKANHEPMEFMKYFACFHEPVRSKSKTNQINYFESKMVSHKPKTPTHLFSMVWLSKRLQVAGEMEKVAGEIF